MENKERIFLTASQAREIAEDSTHLINNVYKNIKQLAKDNMRKLIWEDVSDYNTKAYSDLLDRLNKDGYEVHKYYDMDDKTKVAYIEIRW